MEKFYVSRKKYEDLVKEVKALKEIKAQLSEEIGAAAAQGDLKENAEYHAAKEKQAETLRRIDDLEMKLRNAEITDDLAVDRSEARIGATVTIKDLAADIEFTYTLVGSMESNPDKGLLSVKSPLASGVLGKKEGEEFEAILPRGPKKYKLIKLEYK
ncbi:GreA/GreB family elongation factor [Candidatus Avelusimicrobium aviculae]|uniref:GreA/GreB family elongation factor n=1 Tax=Candidatus Avelusimicrobium aviculae TaxID=3416206 RepID=UPI003D1094F2